VTVVVSIVTAGVPVAVSGISVAVLAAVIEAVGVVSIWATACEALDGNTASLSMVVVTVTSIVHKRADKIFGIFAGVSRTRHC
jgi:hypothetical protein